MNARSTLYRGFQVSVLVLALTGSGFIAAARAGPDPLQQALDYWTLVGLDLSRSDLDIVYDLSECPASAACALPWLDPCRIHVRERYGDSWGLWAHEIGHCLGLVGHEQAPSGSVLGDGPADVEVDRGYLTATAKHPSCLNRLCTRSITQ